MRTSSPALLPVLRSAAVGQLLALLYLRPDQAWTLSELAEETGVSLPTVAREVTRMVTAGLLLERRVGRAREIRANREARSFAPLQELIAQSYGPQPVLTEELTCIVGIEHAFIYGSWAARYSGERGPDPNDVDVMVIGDPDPDDVFQAGERARRRLHREVNVHLITPQAWAHAQDAFLEHVRSSPTLALDPQSPS